MMVTFQSTTANIRENRRDVRIVVFADLNFAGSSAPIIVREKGCTSIPTNLNKQISSISFNSTNELPNCIFGFNNFNCIGTRFLFTDAVPCLNNLALPECNSDNIVTSFKKCSYSDFIVRRRGF